AFARVDEELDIAAGTTSCLGRSIDALAEDMASARPNLVPAVPRIYEKVYARMLAGREAASTLKRALFDWAIAVGRARSRCEQERRPVPIVTSLQNAIAHRLVFARIHQLLGGNIRYMTSGAAPLACEILEFFHAV